MRTHRFGRKIKLPATIAIKHQIRMRGWLYMTSKSQKLKDLADKIITSSTPSRLGRSSTMAVYVSLIDASFCATENHGVRYSRACA